MKKKGEKKGTAKNMDEREKNTETKEKEGIKE